MIPEIAAALSGVKTARDLAEGISALKMSAAVEEKAAELRAVIRSLGADVVALQERVVALIKEKGQLEEELLRYKTWDKEKTKYALSEIAKGVFVFAYRPAEGSGGKEAEEPPHWLCPKCYHDSVKSILQRDGYGDFGMRHKCLVCGAVVVDHSDRPDNSVYFSGGRVDFRGF